MRRPHYITEPVVSGTPMEVRGVPHARGRRRPGPYVVYLSNVITPPATRELATDVDAEKK